MLGKVGFELELQMLDWDSRQAAKIEGKFDIAYQDSDSSSLLVICEELGTEGVGNVGKYSNPELDELCAEALGTVDAEKQHELMGEAMEIILQDAADIPMVRRTFPYAMKEGIEGLTTDSVGVGIYLYDTWINPNP